jgi:hypothetical protein
LCFESISHIDDHVTGSTRYCIMFYRLMANWECGSSHGTRPTTCSRLCLQWRLRHLHSQPWTQKLKMIIAPAKACRGRQDQSESFLVFVSHFRLRCIHFGVGVELFLAFLTAKTIMLSTKIRTDGSVFFSHYHPAYRIDWHLVTSKIDFAYEQDSHCNVR